MIVPYCILAALVILLAVLLANTAVKTGKAPKLGKAEFSFTEQLQGCGRILSEMLRCRTVSVTATEPAEHHKYFVKHYR